jgi:hypothetical protein
VQKILNANILWNADVITMSAPHLTAQGHTGGPNTLWTRASAAARPGRVNAQAHARDRSQYEGRRRTSLAWSATGTSRDGYARIRIRMSLFTTFYFEFGYEYEYYRIQMQNGYFEFGFAFEYLLDL